MSPDTARIMSPSRLKLGARPGGGRRRAGGGRAGPGAGRRGAPVAGGPELAGEPGLQIEGAIQMREGLGRLALLEEGEPPVAMGQGEAGLPPKRLLEVPDRLRPVPEVHERQAQVVAGDRQVRLEPEGLAQVV